VEEEKEKFCWVWRAKLTILVALRKMFLLADLLIAAEIQKYGGRNVSLFFELLIF
jgi:hypothetical protein